MIWGFRIAGWVLGGVGVTISGLPFNDWRMWAMLGCFAISDACLGIARDLRRESNK